MVIHVIIVKILIGFVQPPDDIWKREGGRGGFGWGGQGGGGGGGGRGGGMEDREKVLGGLGVAGNVVGVRMMG